MRYLCANPLALLAVLSILLFGCSSNPGVFYWSDYIKYFGEARYAEVISFHESSGSSIESLEPGDLFALCGSLNKVNQFDRTFGCLELLRNSVAVGEYNFTGIGDSRAYERIWFGQASLAIGDTETAISAAKEAEQIRLTAGNEYFHSKVLEIEIASLLGLAHLARSEFDQVSLEIESLSAIDTTGLTSMLLTTQKYQALASLKFGLGDYEGALSNSQERRSLLMRRWDQGNLLQYALPSMYIEARSLFEAGDIEQSRIKFDELLGSGRIAEFGRIYWVALYDRARIATFEGDKKTAIVRLKEAVDVIESQRTTIDSEASKIGFAGDSEAVYGMLVGELVEAGAYAEAFEYAERGKARALIDVLSTKSRFRGGAEAENPDVVRLLSTIDAADKALLSDPYIDQSDVSRRDRGVAVSSRAALRKVAPQIAELVSVVPVRVSELTAMIDKDEVLVEYFGTANEMIAFVVSQKGVSATVLDVKEMQSSIRRFRNAIVSKDEKIVYDEAARLYTSLYRPIESAVGSKLIVVPHASLHYLPFNALYDGKDFLVDKVALRILPSASVLRYLDPEDRNRDDKLLALGNPDLGDTVYDLPGAEQEVRAIAARAVDSTVIVGANATETTFKAMGSKYGRLHLAMHGTFESASPLASGLLMTPDAINDGVLTVSELYDLYVPADLVTLSACETAMGTIANGDDVVGFTRGFLFAGTQSIVSSLWKVDDEATFFLMERFYRHLETKSKQQALRLAQLDTKARYGSAPYYWAAFQLTGAGD